VRCDGKTKPNKYVRVTGRLRFALRNVLEQPVTVEDGDRKLNFYCDNRDEVWRVMTLLVKEEGTIEWLRSNISSGSIVFDIGANIGLYTIYAASLLNGSGHVFAFEPHAINFAHLVRNIDANGFGTQVSALSIALFDKAGLLPFSYSDWAAGTSKNQLKMNGGRNVFSELKYAAVVDDLVGSGSLPAPDLIKIDVDGAEPQIIRGMRDLMASSQRPRSIQVEIQKNDNGQIVQLMEAQGYRLSSRHFTMAGKNKLKRGLAVEQIAHNCIFSPA
jgi:FkbM family methyltransferase